MSEMSYVRVVTPVDYHAGIVTQVDDSSRMIRSAARYGTYDDDRIVPIASTLVRRFVSEHPIITELSEQNNTHLYCTQTDFDCNHQNQNHPV